MGSIQLALTLPNFPRALPYSATKMAALRGNPPSLFITQKIAGVVMFPELKGYEGSMAQNRQLI